jgi:selenide,water dikinase
MWTAPVGKELVLVGGGHAQVAVLKSFAMRPVAGVRLTLVARDVATPYSGMLPGFVAGHYGFEECHIDLRPLAWRAGARLIRDEAVGLDLAAKRVLCRNHPPLRYDLLALDIGSTPQRRVVPGADAHAIPVKPIDRFAERWTALLERLRAAEAAQDVVVVGGGVAGVELILAMHHRLCGSSVRFALVTREGLLPALNVGARARLARILAARGIAVHERAEVIEVGEREIVCGDGRRVPFDASLWATEAGAAPWLAETDLALDPEGFVAVDASLRSISHRHVFAAGDVAAVLPHPREKAGVFAVRQGPPLARNLRRVLEGREPVPFVPQRRHLALIGTGNAYAVAARGRFSAEGRWAWRLKQWIDRRWMQRYRDLPAMEEEPEAIRCGGCGAKVPEPVLARVMARLAPEPGPEAVLGPGDDAALLRPPRNVLQVQTVGFSRAFLSDPYLFGRIAANHALGGVFAMGATPRTALAMVAVPPAADAVMEGDLYLMLKGGLEVLEAAGARLVGGHSAEGVEPALGFAVTGEATETQLLGKAGLRPDDRLVLTQPLGTGALLAAGMRGKAPLAAYEAALAAMQQSSAAAAGALRAHGATACTDVTSLGLLGHLLEMLQASAVDAVLDPGALPVLPGAEAVLAAGIRSTLQPANEASASALVPGAAAPPILFDPQIAGGLLAGMPAERAEACVAALKALGYADAAVIGRVGAMARAAPTVGLEPA